VSPLPLSVAAGSAAVDDLSHTRHDALQTRHTFVVTLASEQGGGSGPAESRARVHIQADGRPR